MLFSGNDGSLHVSACAKLLQTAILTHFMRGVPKRLIDNPQVRYRSHDKIIGGRLASDPLSGLGILDITISILEDFANIEAVMYQAALVESANDPLIVPNSAAGRRWDFVAREPCNNLPGRDAVGVLGENADHDGGLLFVDHTLAGLPGTRS